MISKSSFQGSHIMIAEDSPTQALSLRRLLEEEGYIVSVAENGKEALRLAKEIMPSLIISDVMMPEMNGYELCRAIKDEDNLKHIPVILLTTLSDATDVISGLECGADNFVTKPYDKEMLLARVSSNLINVEIRKTVKSDVGIEVYFGGKQYHISANRMQILDLLLSTYETAYLKNRKLEKTYDELQRLNASLESTVEERTNHLNQINSLLRVTRDVDKYSRNITTRDDLFRVCCELLTENGYFNYAAIMMTDETGAPLQVVEDCKDETCPIFFRQITHENAPQCVHECAASHGVIKVEWTKNCSGCILEETCKDKTLLMGNMLKGEKLIGMVVLSPTDNLTLNNDDFGVFQEIISEIASRIITIDQNTKLRESEQTLRAISDSTRDAIIMMDNELNISFWNPAAEEMFGYSSNEALGRRLHSTLVPESLRKQALKGLTTFQKNGTGPAIGKCLELTAMKKSGEEFPIEISMSAVKLGGEWHAVGIVRDIEERKKIEIQTSLTQKLQSIGELSAGIAHEINTPTQYISSNVSFLERSFDSLKNIIMSIEPLVCNENKYSCTAFNEILTKSDLQFILDEAPPAIAGCSDGVKRISGIVESMRYFAHPGTDEKTAFEMNTAIENAIVISRNEWKYYADINTSLQEDLPLINCFVAQMNQVLLNIIVNAAQAISSVIGDSPKAKGEISIQSELIDDCIEVRISDNGPGIPEDVRQRIFNPFFTTKDVGKGTGQGLALAHTVVVEKHGGTIDVETKLGAGTTFIIRLPVTTED